MITATRHRLRRHRRARLLRKLPPDPSRYGRRIRSSAILRPALPVWLLPGLARDVGQILRTLPDGLPIRPWIGQKALEEITAVVRRDAQVAPTYSSYPSSSSNAKHRFLRRSALRWYRMRMRRSYSRPLPARGCSQTVIPRRCSLGNIGTRHRSQHTRDNCRLKARLHRKPSPAPKDHGSANRQRFFSSLLVSRF